MIKVKGEEKVNDGFGLSADGRLKDCTRMHNPVLGFIIETGQVVTMASLELGLVIRGGETPTTLSLSRCPVH